MARKLNWDDALQDANKSLRIDPSLTGYVAKGIALCRKRQFRDATKAIALFNANKHDEAMLRVQELVTDFPDTDLLACRVVETYLHVQLGTIALSSWCHKGQAVNHFTSAVSASALFSKSSIHRMYGDFTVLFGWDLESLWLTARKQLCYALIRLSKKTEAYYVLPVEIQPSPRAVTLAF
ncbi:uncharacterized protein F5891DRAFT_979296 [Suillus fuscotomentosus]|uniref:Uncharacterized protein n=1 Tax=Suillus fuscotomentosus TaxID=1912939 RepID=A0AAD4HM92_9AGAM|nr:uncharacterized protein F5891DRAFT_979296 [Suillus fuscotomentosus]KAG1901813.1 hypothetical protein F5891DRAFT_979296 [Suillus fuscotomentosus]